MSSLHSGSTRVLLTVTISLAAVLSLWGCGPAAPGPARGGSASAPAGATPKSSAAASSSDWSAVAIAELDTVQADLVTIANYRPVNGRRSLLSAVHLPQPPSHYFPQPMFDGVATDGQHLIYHLWRNRQAQYYLIGAQTRATAPFYTVKTADEYSAGNAIWMPDSRHVLVLAWQEGVMEVDTQTGQAQNVLPFPLVQDGINVLIVRLRLYRDGYLYFMGGDLCLGASAVSSSRAAIDTSPQSLNCVRGRPPTG